MGWCWCLVLVCVAAVTAMRLEVPPTTSTICGYHQCNCTAAGPWINAVCVFNSTQRLYLTADLLFKNLQELEISGPREMVLGNGSFSGSQSVLYLRLADLGTLTVERQAFTRLGVPSLRLVVEGAQLVILESSAFHDLRRTTVSVSLERVGRLVVQKHAFNRLLDLDVRRVDLLELERNAFFYNPDRSGDQDPATKITMEQVNITELPENVFPSLNLLSIVNSNVSVVRREAFGAMILHTVRIVNSTLKTVEKHAFSERTMISRIELDGVVVGKMESNSVQSGISHLVIHGSSLADVAESAFHATVATASLSYNVFDRVRSRGFNLKETTALTVENNQFNILEESAFTLPEAIPGKIVNVTFRGNTLGEKIGKDAFDFTRSKDVGTNIENNRFESKCQCEGDMKTWLRERINGSDRVIESFYETSLCQINDELSRCLGLPLSMFLMGNFTSEVCLEGGYECRPEVVQSDAAEPSHPGTTSDIVLDHTTDREKKLVGSIFIFVISGVILMTFFSGLMWLRRNGYCTKARLLLFPSAESLLTIISRLFFGSTTTSSSAAVNRTSAHEYAELDQVHKQVEEIVEDDVSLEDKATQTLPEELTQELLQSLREKLDDPENYGEARDMIEHLYDLIKVEESCNQNSDFTSITLEDLDDVREGENVYDVIQPKPKTKTRTCRVKKSLVSVGTRAPSPDKLLPLSLTRTKPAVLCEYADPRDRQQNLYAEPLAVRPSASVLNDYMEPPDSKPHVYVELPAAIANRPLPSKPDQQSAGPSSR